VTESVLSTELATFAGMKSELLANSRGKYALIRGQELAGTYDTEGDAISEGYRRFGNVPFLVKEIVEVEKAANFISNLIAL
jgi:hypothetical protein